jgi:hypothetical protein
MCHAWSIPRDDMTMLFDDPRAHAHAAANGLA